MKEQFSAPLQRWYDLTLGFKNHVWNQLVLSMRRAEGFCRVAPTDEVFTAPDRRADGHMSPSTNRFSL